MSAWLEFENQELKEELDKLRKEKQELKARVERLEGLTRKQLVAIEARCNAVVSYAQMFIYRVGIENRGVQMWTLRELGSPPFSLLKDE